MSSNAEQIPYDSTLNSLLNLRTFLARFSFWINIPFCWIFVLLTMTSHLSSWQSKLPAEKQYWVNVFAGFMGVWLFLSHTVIFFGAILCELWYNPYMHHPKLRGKVSVEEEEHLLMENRRKAKWLWNGTFGDKPQKCSHCGR